ncbi:integrase [Massilia varians]|uniref:Integrase n=1 Tax=Massilia varians TaxID=457921 RepID=A0ABN6TJL7_9BURK|nr:site-specific integrase [Massilia varians]BDT60491.1 integrase [Massilia varians]
MERIITTKARTIVLPRLSLTHVVSSDTPFASKVALPDGSSPESYFVRPYLDEKVGKRFDDRPSWMGTQFNLFPVVVDSNGAPWAEATVYLLSRLEGSLDPLMTTYSGIAKDLASFLQFIEESGTDWTYFPRRKLERPTYRYRAQLRLSVSAGEMAASTAKRRIGTVIAFYRWLQREGVLNIENPPWVDSDRYIQFTDSQGQRQSMKVRTTDLRISAPKTDDPYSELIEDGGKLRPLPEVEQRWLLDALANLGNTELTLIHLFAILTGARIQTILTFRVRHVLERRLLATDSGEVRIPVGPGTGIDTKDDKKMVLHIPVWFYESLSQYAQSERAIKRRIRAKGGDSPDQYLFLSARGAPLYVSKAEAKEYNDENVLRHTKDGQAVRQLIRDYIIPNIQLTHDPKFAYRFHDMRATFGMNLTDEQLKRVSSGEITLHQAREFVKTRMGHESAATTDLYLQYRGRLKFIRRVNIEYDEHLKTIAANALMATS